MTAFWVEYLIATRIRVTSYLQNTEGGQAVPPDVCPASSSSLHDHYNLNPQSKPRPRSGVGGLDVLQEMLNHLQLSVACHFGSASKADIESFIQAVVEGGDEYDSRLFQSHANDLRVARLKMLEFIDAWFPEFSIDSVEGLAACRAELMRQSGLLRDRQITPATFCQFFNSMESELVISLDLSADEVAFLGDLFNACDWCDKTWTLESAPYLAEEASRVASRIEEAEPRHDNHYQPPCFDDFQELQH